MPPCSECNDTGMVGKSICPKCNGYGGKKRASLSEYECEVRMLLSNDQGIFRDTWSVDYRTVGWGGGLRGDGKHRETRIRWRELQATV